MADTPRDTSPRVYGTEDTPSTPPHPGAAAAQARAAHDSGQFRDKIAAPDPSMTPLGSDSEASGFRQGEGSLEPPPSPSPAQPGTHPEGHARGDYESERGTGRWVMTIAAGAVAGLLFLFVAVIAFGGA